MAFKLKRLPEKRYQYLLRHYIGKQKQTITFRALQGMNYTWTQGIGEENRDSDEESKQQTKEKGR